ncbi:hypothetical protein [Burkholderia savannae]|uniref:hypothetical protein n=1 Tax=Burkholderia savannae TaxID=1637837 RepID=UPI0018DB15B9|nr:hypothetical protein [Burkholderia savannae]
MNSAARIASFLGNFMRAIKRIPGPNICLLIPAPFRCDETTVSASFPPYTDRSTRHLSELKQNQSSDIAIKIFATSRTHDSTFAHAASFVRIERGASEFVRRCAACSAMLGFPEHFLTQIKIAPDVGYPQRIRSRISVRARRIIHAGAPCHAAVRRWTGRLVRRRRGIATRGRARALDPHRFTH